MKPRLRTDTVCGEPSPYYFDPEHRCCRDLCLTKRGHRGKHTWPGWTETQTKRPGVTTSEPPTKKGQPK